MSEHLSLLIRASTAFAAIASRHHNLRTKVPILLAAASPTIAKSEKDGSIDTSSTSSNDDIKVKEEEEEEEINSRSIFAAVGQQLTFGGSLGFATAYAIRTLSKPILFLVGTEVLILQYFAYREWLTIHWTRIAHDMSFSVSRPSVNGLLDILVYKMPFSASFTGGLYAGLR